MDSTKSPNNTSNHNQNQNHHPHPLMHYHPSSEHGRTYAFNVPPISSQNTFTAPNTTTLMQFPHSSFSSRNLVHGNDSSSLSKPSWVNNFPGFEDIKFAMGGFCLLSSDPATRNRSTDDLSSDFLDYLEWDEICDSEDDMELEMVNDIRDQSAATAAYSSPGIEDFQSSMEGLSLLSSDPGIEDIQSDIGGLLLSSDPLTRNSSTDLSSDYLPFIDCDDYISLETRLMLNNIRAQSAASAFSSSYHSCSLFAGVGGNSNRVLAPLGRGGYNSNGINLERPIMKLKSSPPNVVLMARDQCGCRRLQAKIDEGTPEEVQFILSQVKDHCLHLMMHPFGNYLIQKIFEAKTVTAKQIDMMLNSIIKDEQKLKQVCCNDHGTRAAQQVLKNLRTDWQVSLFACVIRRITVPLMKNINASYVIEELLKTFPMTFKKSIFYEVARNCVNIATDRNGCSSIQRCMANAPYVDALKVLLEEIILNAPVLSQDHYGNYVMQYLIKLGVQPIISMIVSHLGGKYAQLCMNKYGSHVVEDLFKYSEERDLTIITEEIMHNTDFLKVLQDPFGNFVIQKALKFTKGDLQKKLVSGILSNSGNLASHLYGKRVLARAKGCRIHVSETDL